MTLKEEIEFINSIDSSFPFENEDEVKRLISRGAAISDNAALMIGLELISEPSGRFADLSLSALEQLYRERPTQAIRIAAPVIESLIRRAPFSEGSVECLLEYCRQHKGCYNALGILASCSPAMEEEAKKILESW
jgi:hypothetical protein